MASKKYFVDIDLQSNKVDNLKADTLDITTNLASANTKRIVYWNGVYYYSDGTNWVAMNGSGGSGSVTSIATSSPITGGTITTSGTIGISQSTTSDDGYLSSTDWNTFNNKQDELTSGTNIKTVNSNSLLGSGDLSVGTVTSVEGGTGLNGGTITDSGTLSVIYGTTSGTAAEGNDARLSDSRTPTGTAGGDLSGTYPNPTVDGLQGNPVSNATPANGQTLQWNGSAWIPGAIPNGGSGGGGVVYYLNYQNTTDISPTTGLPTSPVAPSQLGITYSVGAGSITSANLIEGSYSLICGFVTIVGTPGVTNIPAGLWDFNIWCDVDGHTGSANQTQFQIRIYKYNSSTGVYTSLANSDDVYIYDPQTTAQYIANVTMPQTTILSTDRIYVQLWAQKNVNQTRAVVFYFDSLHPSHVHTTIPSVAGTGVVKVVNGVFQSPASTIVNADVSATAAIAQSKLSLIDSVADGATKGIATFTASDFNSSSGVISIDYTNGQSASASNKGFLTSTDWSTFNGKIEGSGTANQISYFTASGTIASLSTATYPSLTELSYVKGVTSAIQTQIDNTYIARVQSVVSSATVTPTFANDEVIITAQAVNLTLNNPTGTATEGKSLIVRIKDNGTARSITFDTQYRAVNVNLPTSTTASRTLYLGMIYNATDTRWDITGVALENANPDNTVQLLYYSNNC